MSPPCKRVHVAWKIHILLLEYKLYNNAKNKHKFVNMVKMRVQVKSTKKAGRPRRRGNNMRSVAGPGVKCRRYTGKVLQVPGQSVAGLHFCCHLRRKSASGAKNRRRSGRFCRPATVRRLTCDGSASDLRHLATPPATYTTKKEETCVTSFGTG